ncbi:MAG: tRNA (guanosine(37)-N1)-methyltransferase TrmD [Roseburia sp.]|nr:tRNA (guanosine(37)-N1)-methyltransferase TrmD [Anaeroplasma bactoclasticum]MCM1196507.1 tRNA (guanosine(37)-N1)-methyltransferase TrmD [Roseburia sp.]MCM1556433.1 tRNA (guanosine(37)-N1)-methyltransferase TrmD [Anaeroplasma bactoclasticum]
MKIKILTLFPNMFEGILGESILKRAISSQVCSVELVDMRDYSLDKHHHVDDTPYGGGAGMVLACDVVDRAIEANTTNASYKILMTPQGRPYKQSIAKKLASKEELVLICGHYEGFDERIRGYVDDEISIGDYILTGGELAAGVVCDSVIRLLDSAIRKESSEDDSFSDGLLEYPQYTRPLEYKGVSVPEVLVNGNHKLIREYRLKESLRKTYLRRPDLLKNRMLSKEEEKLLKEIIEESK